MTVSRKRDAYGSELMAVYQGATNMSEIVEREDHLCEAQAGKSWKFLQTKGPGYTAVITKQPKSIR